MKKLFAKLHLWLSIPFGLVITVMCLTGAILIFENEITRMLHPARFYVTEVKEQPILLDQLMPKVKQQLPDTIEIASVVIPAQNDMNYTFNIKGEGRMMVMVDPYTGTIRETVTMQSQSEFFATVRKLHRWFLFDTQKGEISFGKLLTGTSTLLFVVIIISGIVIWVPKSYRMLMNRLSIRWSNGQFRFWYDLHLAGGMYAALFLLLFCLTGLTWSFNWYRTGFYKLFGAEMVQNNEPEKFAGAKGKPQGEAEANKSKPNGNEGEPLRAESKDSTRQHGPDHSRGQSNIAEGMGGADDRQPSRGEGGESMRLGGDDNEGADAERGHRDGGMKPYRIWSQVVEELKQSNPDYYQITIAEGSAMVANDANKARATDKYSFDKRSGEIIDVKYYKDSDAATKMRSTVFALHVGNWGGMMTRVLSFVACLIGASLPLTGYYMYIKKWMTKRRNKHRIGMMAD